MSILALIPARGGSKGLPGKNLIEFGGKPLLAWSVEAARESKAPISRVIVSSEDSDILKAAAEAGAECPFIRPTELASDEASGLDPVLHALDWLAKYEDYHPEWLLLLQPTSPLRTAKDIDNSYQLVLEKEGDSVMGVTEAQSHPSWTKMVDEKGLLKDFVPREHLPATRQELQKAYVVNGAIYLIRVDTLREIGGFSNKETLAYIMPQERSVDIDTEFDLRIARFLLSQKE